MLREDNSGFVIFPNRTNTKVDRFDTGKTYIYLVAFDIEDVNGGRYCLSNTTLELQGNFVSDDISKRGFDEGQIYFQDEDISIPLTSCVCLGWSSFTFEFKEGFSWTASFDSLTNEGKKLYYSLRKLHNNKEVRILTFNNVD